MKRLKHREVTYLAKVTLLVGAGIHTGSGWNMRPCLPLQEIISQVPLLQKVRFTLQLFNVKSLCFYIKDKVFPKDKYYLLLT